jgi:hypothetical protein
MGRIEEWPLTNPYKVVKGISGLKVRNVRHERCVEGF